MFLIAGLGNPGKKYDKTRHNLGFEVIDALAENFGEAGQGHWKSEKQASTQKIRMVGEDVLLCKPQTFMNLSGDAVGNLQRYYKINLGNIIVVHDELDFDPGLLKLKKGGGSGGHNGLKSITSHCGPDYFRVRMGIGKPRGKGSNFVLSPFNKAERQLVDVSINMAIDLIKTLLSDGPTKAMGLYN